METKKLTFLLSLTFLFLFSGSVYGEELEVKREYWKKYILFGKGNLKTEVHYKNGKEEGLSTFWYKSGKKKGERHYKSGKLDGPSRWWYESGMIMGEEHFKNGGRHGRQTWWNKNGNKISEKHFINGIEQLKKNRLK